MKKFLSILLTLCLISALFVVPASALTFSKTIDLDAANIVSHTVSTSNAYVAEGTPAEIAEFPVSNLFDGDTNTTAVLNFAGRSKYWNGSSSGHEISDVFLSSALVIDLGAPYVISGLEFTWPTATQIAAVTDIYSTYVNPASTSTPGRGNVTLYAEDPATGAAGTSISKDTQLKNGFNYDTENAYRYIKITGLWGNGATFANELKVKTPYADDDTSVKYELLPNNGGEVTKSAYSIDKIFDGDTNTHALISSHNDTSGGMAVRVIDLGESKNLSKISITAPSSANYKAVLDDLGITSQNGNYGNIYVTNSIPDSVTSYSTAASAVSSMTSVHSGQITTKDITLDGSAVRYIVLHVTMASYPCVISEMELAWDDRTGSVSFETTAAAGNVKSTTYAAHYGTANGAGSHSFNQYPVSNLFDNDSNTVGFLYNADSNGNTKPVNVIIDLGKAYELSTVTYNFPSTDVKSAILTETGITVTGSNASNTTNGVNAVDGAGLAIYGSATAPTVNSDGTVKQPDDYKKLTVYGTIGPDDWRKEMQNLEGNSYRYITISCPNNYALMLTDFIVKDTAGTDLIQATKDVMRFYVAPTLTSQFYDTEEFGMYIIPFAIFESEGNATTSGEMLSMEAVITTGQNYAADLVDIPSDNADTPVVVVPFVKLGGDYFYGGASSQFTLNGLK